MFRRVVKLPLIRKIINAGRTSRAVILPKSWLKFLERKYGQEITEVAIEVDEVLKVGAVVKESARSE
jgi:hypothetical protein